MKLALEDNNETLIETDEMVLCSKGVFACDDCKEEMPAIHVVFRNGARTSLIYDNPKARDEQHEHIGYMSGAR